MLNELLFFIKRLMQKCYDFVFPLHGPDGRRHNANSGWFFTHLNLQVHGAVVSVDVKNVVVQPVA